MTKEDSFDVITDGGGLVAWAITIFLGRYIAYAERLVTRMRSSCNNEASIMQCMASFTWRFPFSILGSQSIISKVFVRTKRWCLQCGLRSVCHATQIGWVLASSMVIGFAPGEATGDAVVWLRLAQCAVWSSALRGECRRTNYCSAKKILRIEQLI